MKQDAGSRSDEMIAKLKSSGCRITPQRIAILRILAESNGHPSAENIHASIKAQFPTTSLATVYKVIATLKEMGEVLELGFADGSSRYDGNNPHPHAHLICVRCKTILDPTAAQLDTLWREIAMEAGYRPVGHRFDIYGICPSCAMPEQEIE